MLGIYDFGEALYKSGHVKFTVACLKLVDCSIVAFKKENITFQCLDLRSKGTKSSLP